MHPGRVANTPAPSPPTGHFISPQADFESILSMLSSFFVPEDEDALLRWVGKMLKRGAVREQMEAWKQEWRAEQKKMT